MVPVFVAGMALHTSERLRLPGHAVGDASVGVMTDGAALDHGHVFVSERALFFSVTGQA
jgi:hypothetical protein